MMRTVLILSILVVVSSSCKKTSMTNKCCRNTFEISPANYDTTGIEIYVPQAFSPDGDGTNEQFAPMSSGWQVGSIEIRNNLSTVFTSTNADAWDGFKDNGKAAKNGTYRYSLVLWTINGENITVEGNVCIARCVDRNCSMFALLCDCLFASDIDPAVQTYQPGRTDCP